MQDRLMAALVFSHVNLCFFQTRIRLEMPLCFHMWICVSKTKIQLEMPLCFVLPAEWINPNCLTRPPSCFRSQGEMFQRTNLENKGLISADRNNKATLLLTIPRSVFKSSTKDLSPPISCIAFQWLLACRFRLLGSHSRMMLDPKIYW